MFTRKDPSKKRLILVASIGNPSPMYDGTRHSVGHYILERYCCAEGYNSSVSLGMFEFRRNAKPDCFLFYHNKGFMNESGKNLLGPWNEFKRYAIQEGKTPALVVLSDDLDSDLGSWHIRKQNSSARGHNGLKSIQMVIGRGFTSVKIGIGRNYPGGGKDSESVSKYVLGKFTPEEIEILNRDLINKLVNVFTLLSSGPYIYNVQK